jgi:VanZ family protein
MTPQEDDKKTSSSTPTKTIKILGAIYFFFLLYLMWAADSGNLPEYASFLYDFRYGDKVGHFVLYGGVAFVLCLAFPKSFQVWRFKIPFIALFFLLFALGEEWSQTLFPRRTPDWLDGACSAVGIILGSSIASFIKKRP